MEVLRVFREFFDGVLDRCWGRFVKLNRVVCFYVYLCLRYGVFPRELYDGVLEGNVLVCGGRRVVLGERDAGVLRRIGFPRERWGSVGSFVKAVSREVRVVQWTETKLNFVELMVLRDLLEGRGVRIGVSTFVKFLELFLELRGEGG